MSFLYITDRNIMRKIVNDVLDEAGASENQYRYHAFMEEAMKRGVSFEHFSRYGKNNRYYYEDTSFVCNLIRKGIINVEKTEIAPTRDYDLSVDKVDEVDNDSLNEGFMVTDHKEYSYSYTVDQNHPELDNMIMDYVKKDSFITKKSSYGMNAKQYIDMQLNNIENPRNFGERGNEIKGLREAFVHNIDKIEVFIRKNYVGHQIADDLRKEINRAPIYAFGRLGTEKEVSESGNNIMHDLKSLVIANRRHSPLYSFFHPFKYRNEQATIERAKDTLVRLGVKREKVEDFVNKVKLQDEYLNDKNDMTKFYELETDELNDFDTLKRNVDLEEDGLAMEDGTEFENRLQNDINLDKNLDIDNKRTEISNAKENSLEFKQ